MSVLEVTNLPPISPKNYNYCENTSFYVRRGEHKCLIPNSIHLFYNVLHSTTFIRNLDRGINLQITNAKSCSFVKM